MEHLHISGLIDRFTSNLAKSTQLKPKYPHSTISKELDKQSERNSTRTRDLPTENSTPGLPLVIIMKTLQNCIEIIIGSLLEKY